MSLNEEANQIVLRRVSKLDVEAPPVAAADTLAVRVRRNWMLIFVVIVPMTLATVYYLFIAADIYETEARFVVRSASATSGLGSIGAVLPSASIGRSSDDTHSVNAYMVSRDSVDRLVKETGFLQMLAVPEADFLSRFPRPFESTTRERLMKRLSDFISVSYDSTAGISTLRVRAFRPEHAQQLAVALEKNAEELINRLNERARADAIQFAADVVQKAEHRVAQSQQRIAEFRRRELVFDPARQSTAALDLLSKMNGELAQLKAALAEATTVAPSGPQVTALKGKVQALEEQIKQQLHLITGGPDSLAPKLARYEQLTLERELATKSLTSALLSLENARLEAQRQHLYLERVVTPTLSDQPRYPARLASLAFILFVLGCIYVTLSWLREVVMEHDP